MRRRFTTSPLETSSTQRPTTVSSRSRSADTSPTSRGCGSLEGLIVLPEHGRGDLQRQDLVGALVEPGHAGVLEVAARPEGFEESAAAEDLHGAIGGVAGGARGVQLG